jgi:putative Mn2+ efflux pump MntP
MEPFTMSFLTMFLIAVGLAMDAFAVSIGSGLTIKQLKVRHALQIAAFFGLFQAMMPVLGWLGGLSFKALVSRIDHWIAFILLVAIGVRMIYESGRQKAEGKRKNPLKLPILLVLSVATSIDALAVGVSLAFLDVAILCPVVVIGAVTLILSFAGVYIGDRLGHFFERKIEALGGLILIAIGLKILIEHLTAG